MKILIIVALFVFTAIFAFAGDVIPQNSKLSDMSGPAYDYAKVVDALSGWDVLYDEAVAVSAGYKLPTKVMVSCPNDNEVTDVIFNSANQHGRNSITFERRGLSIKPNSLKHPDTFFGHCGRGNGAWYRFVFLTGSEGAWKTTHRDSPRLEAILRSGQFGCRQRLLTKPPWSTPTVIFTLASAPVM